MLSQEYLSLIEEFRIHPAENPKRIGYSALRKQQEERIINNKQVCAEVSQVPDSIQSVPVEWLIPQGADKDKLIIYIHGGSWALGSIPSTRQYLSPMAKEIGIQALAIGYRLMPENPFPLGLEDCFSVYKAILEQGRLPQNIILMGESAGANLVLALVLMLKDKHIPLPKALVAMSPVTYMDNLEGSHTELADIEHILTEDSFVVTEVCRLYAPGINPSHPYLSPLYGDLSGFPSTLLMVGTDEILFDDTIRFYKKERLSHVDATLAVGDHMLHSWPIFINQFPEANEGVGLIKKYIDDSFNIN